MKVKTIIILLILVVATGILSMDCTKEADDLAPISTLSFEEVDRRVRSSFTKSEAERYSRELKGTRVRWSGVVKDIDEMGMVYIAVAGVKPNVKFRMKKNRSSDLEHGQEVMFVGAIEKVYIVETFPPMPNTHVFLDHARIE